MTVDNNALLAHMTLKASLLPQDEARRLQASLTADDDRILETVAPEDWPPALYAKVAKLMPHQQDEA